MKKFWFIPFLALSIMLAACSDDSDQPVEETASNTESERSETEKSETENEDSKGKSQEEESEERAETEETTEIEEEESITEEASAEETDTDESEIEEAGPDKSAVVFDINSEGVQSQLLGTTTGNEDGTFTQDAITEGMTQTEVEEKYGPYDFSFYAGGTAPAFHGNLAVVYSQLAPYGPGDDGSDASINPDENYVQDVYYSANITGEKLIAALGEPDELAEGYDSMNGLPYYIYEGVGEDGRYYSTGIRSFNSPEGVLVGIVKRSIHDEDPAEMNSANSGEGYPVELTNENGEFDILSGFIFDEYLPGLADYYNDEGDYVLSLLEGNALQMIQENKSSGNFADYKNYNGAAVSAQQISESEYQITVDRAYSHATSNGEATSQVTYTVVDMDGILKVIDYK